MVEHAWDSPSERDITAFVAALSVEKFDEPITTAVHRLPNPHATFEAFHLANVSRGWEARPVFNRGRAVLANDEEEREFGRRKEETVVCFANRLSEEAARMEADWLFVGHGDRDHIAMDRCTHSVLVGGQGVPAPYFQVLDARGGPIVPF